uniref:Variant SH3 domain protein n=1 Tax=Haemonchus contortus TaxID=6289 RepID=A0A7I4YDB5_HAECO
MSLSASPAPPVQGLGPLVAGAGPPSGDSLLLTLRNKPHARVFRALFQYLPLRDSPNENPQLELTLAPGDVLLVKGEMDSDGFYRAETLDGRTGLVPSNYVERVPDSVLLCNARAPSPSFPLQVPQHHSTITHDFSEPDHSQLPDSVCPYPPADVSKVTVQEIKQNDTPRVPCPRELVVEKKMSRSVVVAWSPPEESFVAVSQYHVCVDGQVRAVVPGSYKCRALVEDVALDGSVNLSVRALSDQGHSPDAACTITLGNEAAVAPQHLRVWAVTPLSACVRWYPSNSNADHVVSLNAVKVGVCPPTVFQVQLQGLQPSTIYRVSVRTKHPKAVLEQRPVERCLDFKTLPKIGLPDPPTNVQAENGPQAGTLLISWTPVTNQPKPPSRAAVHSYLIYADGKNIAQVPSATADHVLLRLADLSDDPPIFITVRTRTREGAVSCDSNVARVPRGPSFGAISDGLLQTAPLLDMAQSFPTGHYVAPLSGPQSAPYTAPPMLTSMPFQANPLSSYTASAIQGYNSLVGTDRIGPATLGGQAMSAASAIPGASGTLAPTAMPMSGLGAGTTLPNAMNTPGTLPISTALCSTSMAGALSAGAQGTLPKWKTSQMKQYYTFHPRLIRGDGTSADEPRPSVPDMENSYLLRHRQSDWAGHSEWAGPMDARMRIDAYARQGTRAGSAEDRPPARHRLVPPRLARVKSESGFGTRSEPDLRPPTLEDDCRWFVALFDYSHHMSPNANAEADELSFRKHQLIKVYGEVDADGFYHGQIGNRVGLVPSNMVIEIAKDDLLPRRTRTDAVPSGAEPTLRRMRWGSLKSRSYDHAGDRRTHDRPPTTSHFGSSLDRRELERREVSATRGERYRRSNGRDYEYRRDYDDRYREMREPREHREMRDPRATRDDYHRDYRDEEEYWAEKYRDRGYERERERDRDYERRDDRREERREAERREVERREVERRDVERREVERREAERREERREYERRHEYPREEPYRRDRRDEGYREDRHYDPYAQRYDPGNAGPSGAVQPVAAPQQTGQGPSHGGPPQMAQLAHQLGQMQMVTSAMQPSAAQQMPQALPGLSTGMQPGVLDTGINGVPTKKMVAKFDYDSRQLSPNVDAEQVELSFRQGDIITVYGEMDDDGFYMGELNGLRGLVPSNFLQSSPLTSLAPSQPTEPMRKGVAFSDAQAVASKKAMPTRQISQTSTVTPTTAKPTSKKSAAAAPSGKPLTKKASDVSKTSAQNLRKTSQAVKKGDSSGKKK